MRGLKPVWGRIGQSESLSHLLQMRGLKLRKKCLMKWKKDVASFTDAWIETYCICSKAKSRRVASFTDAWIETLITKGLVLTFLSHLLQMRGLKPLFKGAFERVFNVASFTGTTIYNIFCKKITGLKYLFVRK